MELFVVSDSLSAIGSTQGLGHGVSKFLLNRNCSSFTSNSSSDQCGGTLQVSAVIFPIDAIAPPPVKSNRVKTLPRRSIKKRRRTRRKTASGDDGYGDDGGEEVFVFFGDGGDFGGPFDNNWGGGGSGKGWNFGGFGGADWGDSSANNSYDDPAFDFVYEVLSWIVFSNCLHFAFKKMVRIMADGLGDPAREKVPIRLSPVC